MYVVHGPFVDKPHTMQYNPLFGVYTIRDAKIGSYTLLIRMILFNYHIQ